jgi:tetratricopeptide (TPR) repeat protein
MKNGIQIVLPFLLAIWLLGQLFPPAPVAAVAQQDPVRNEAEEKIKPLIVMITSQIESESHIGAGIIFGQSNNRLYIVTANHVVRRGLQEAKDVRVQFKWLPGEKLEAKLLEHADSTLDLAVIAVKEADKLGIPANTLRFDQLGDTSALKREDFVYLIGNPQGKNWRITVSPDKVTEKLNDSISFESLHNAPGFSGGGLLNESLQLVGMIKTDDSVDGKAVNMQSALDTLTHWGYPVSLKRGETTAIEIWTGKAQDALGNKNYSEAITLATKVIELNQKSDTAYYIRGSSQASLGNHQRAIEDFSKAIDLDPKLEGTYEGRAESRKAIKNYQGAIEDYSKAIDLSSQDAGTRRVLYYARGNVKFEIEDYQAAIEDFSKCIDLETKDDKSVKPYLFRGMARQFLNDNKGAIEDLSIFIEIRQDFDRAYYARGTAKDALKDYQGAIEDYSKAIDLNPKLKGAYEGRAKSREAIKNYQGAIEDYSGMINLDPKDGSTYLFRGKAKADLKDYQGAIEDYSKAINIPSQNADIYTGLYIFRGIAKFMINDYQAAIEDLSKCIDLEPKDNKSVNPHLYRGMARQLLNDNKGAIEDLSIVIEIRQDVGLAYYSRGMAKDALKDYQGAIEDYIRAAKLGEEGAQKWLKEHGHSWQ